MMKQLPHSYDEIAEEAESYCMLVVDYIKLNILSDWSKI